MGRLPEPNNISVATNARSGKGKSEKRLYLLEFKKGTRKPPLSEPHLLSNGRGGSLLYKVAERDTLVVQLEKMS